MNERTRLRRIASEIDEVGAGVWSRWASTCSWCARQIACAGDRYACAGITAEWERVCRNER